MQHSNPYSGIQLLKPIPVMLLSKDLNQVREQIPFSLILTVKNEAQAIKEFLSSVEHQTSRPSEVIIIDGGSTDGTPTIINKYSSRSELKIELFQRQSLNIAEGRNEAINSAENEFIVVADAGCILDPKCCENLIQGFRYDEQIDLVAGVYKLQNKTLVRRIFVRHFIPDWEKLNPAEFLPSSRCVAIKKTIFIKSGGYPTWLSLTGEDTLFDLNYRKVSRKWAIIKDAVVYWKFPTDLSSILKLAYKYGKGDGESGVGDYLYYLQSKVPKTRSKRIDFRMIRDEVLRGYIEGRKNRIDVYLKRRGIKGNVLIFSDHDFTHKGGEQRSTLIALGFIKMNYKVTFVNLYPITKNTDKIFFDIDYTLLELENASLFDIDDYLVRHKNVLDRTIVVISTPSQFFIPFIKKLRDKRSQIICDCLDELIANIGSTQGNKYLFDDILNNSDILIASSIPLKEKIELIATGRHVYFVENRVDSIILFLIGRIR